MRFFLIIFSTFLLCASSEAYNFRSLIDQNPKLVEKFQSFARYKALRKTKIAVVGDYIHTDVFENLLDINSSETPSNGIDDDNNGYVDDFYGVDITTRNGNLTSPKLSGHENGIVSLLDALTRELHFEDAVSVIPVSIVLSQNKFDELSMKKLADAIDYARERGAKIISLSLGISKAYRSSFQFIEGDYERSISYLSNAIKRAKEEGIIVLGANSNDSQRDHAIEPQIPANLEHVISVANVDYDGHIRSGYGDNTELAFYGTNMYVWSGKDFGYNIRTGSSYATPLVALTLALTNSISKKELQSDALLAKHLKNSCEFKIRTQRNISSRCVFSPSLFLNKSLTYR